MGPRSIVLNLLIKLLLVAVATLLVVGAVERERLFWLLGLMIVVRGWVLWCEWRKPRAGDERWRLLEREHALSWWRDEQENMAAAPAGHDAVPDEDALARTLVASEVKADFARLHARRADADILSEALSLVITAPGAFLLALMLTSPVVTWSGSDRGPAALALAVGFGLHFLANAILAARPARRVLLRAVLMAGVVVPVVIVAKARHPYLLTQGTKHRSMIAARVWGMGTTVQAGRHADVLVAYARDLEAERRWAAARVIYERALALDALRKDAHEGLVRVLDELGEPDSAAEARRAALAIIETEGEPANEKAGGAGLPLFDWSEPARLRVCLVPVGEVPDALLDAAGRRMGRVLGAEVFRWHETLPLPAADRRAALMGAGQWQPIPLRRIFFDRLVEELKRGRRAAGAWQFILVTDADLYLPDTNYVFGVSFPVHGVVSFARFGDGADSRRAERLAKQLVSTAIKNFGGGQAGRADCVTAYVRSLAEHDRKPITPAGPTLAEYRRRVELWERDPARLPEPPS